MDRTDDRSITSPGSSSPSPVDESDASIHPIVRWAPALRHRYFRWYLVGHLFSVIGGWMQDAGLRWYVQILTKEIGSERWLGITGAIAALPIVVFSPLGGALADRLPKRLMIAATQSADMIIALSLGLLVWFDALPLGLVLVFAALHGTFLAFDIPARQSFAIEMVGRRDLMSAIGLNSTIFNLGRLVGPMSAGIAMISGAWIARHAMDWGLVPTGSMDAARGEIADKIGLVPNTALMDATRAGVAACFLLNAVSFSGLIFLLIFLPLTRSEAEETASSKAERRNLNLLDGFRTVVARPQSLGLLGCLLLFLLAGGSYPTLIPALADYELKTDERGYSLLLTANGIGSVAGALVVASVHRLRSRRLVIVTGLSLVAIGLAATASSKSLLPACASLFLTGAGVILFLASANSTIQLSVPDAVRGRVMSVWVAVFGIGMPMGSLLSGYVAQFIGTSNTLWYQGWATWGAVVLAFFVLRGDQTVEKDVPTVSTDPEELP
jgi:predicted MFS family arabinose efflux permease